MGKREDRERGCERECGGCERLGRVRERDRESKRGRERVWESERKLGGWVKERWRGCARVGRVCERVRVGRV